ncbi:MAG: ABC transporter ATP-binding protein [Solirubrobacterales bacterium]
MSQPDDAPALRIVGLEKRYRGEKRALEGVDLEVGRGELVGLLGPNGAGKSTLTKIACGLVRPSAGEVQVAGVAPSEPFARTRVGYLAELFRFPAWLRAEELLGLHQDLSGSGGGASERAELLGLVGLPDAARIPVGEMSKGMQQRLGIAQALIGEPRLLLLDEPTSALDPAGRRIVRELLVEVRSRGVGVLLNSHLLGEVEMVCDSVTIIDGGRVVATGSAAELRGGPVVEVETDAGPQRFEGVGRSEIPALVAKLVGEGASVYSVSEVSSSLEDAYLAAVEGGDGGGGEGRPPR